MSNPPEPEWPHPAPNSTTFNNQTVTAFVLGGCLGFVLAVVAMTLWHRTQPVAIVIQPPPTAVPSPTPGPIQVYINGAVHTPAVYTLPPEALVEDVVRLAGGFTPEAYSAGVNLAQAVQSGMQIYVPHQSERELKETAVITVNNVPIAVNDPAGQNNPSSATAGGLININTATQAELEQLPGVGPATAVSIITHREQQGAFRSIDGLMDVSGIGPAKFEQVRALITVGD